MSFAALRRVLFDRSLPAASFFSPLTGESISEGISRERKYPSVSLCTSEIGFRWSAQRSPLFLLDRLARSPLELLFLPARYVYVFKSVFPSPSLSLSPSFFLFPSLVVFDGK